MKRIFIYILLLLSTYAYTNNCIDYKQEKVESIGGQIAVTEIDSCTWTIAANPLNGYKFAYWKNLYGTVVFEREFTLEIDTTIQNYLYEATFVRDNAFIYKWLDDSIIIRTDTTDLLSGLNTAGWSYTLVDGEIRITDEDERITKLDWGVWKSDVTEVINRNEYAGLPLHMIIHNPCNKTSAVIDTIIPVVVHDTMYAHTMEFPNVPHCDLQILEDAVLYVDSNIVVNGILDIHEGGKVVINENKTLTAQGIILRGDGITKKWAQMYIKGEVINNNNNLIFYDYTLNSSEYYPLSLPDSVYCNSIISSITGEATNYTSLMYDTYVRNTHNTGWQVFNDSRYIMGNGYIMYSPVNRWKGNENYRQQSNIIRYPIRVDLSNEKEDKYISIYNEQDESIRPSDKNWNLIGNPYLSNYKITYGSMIFAGEPNNMGRFNYEDIIQYITYSLDGYKTYEQEMVFGFIMKPFNAYFIQVDEGNYIMFERDQQVYFTMFSPRRSQRSEFRTGIKLTQDNRTERIGLLYGDYTNQYEINADLAKMFGNVNVMYAYSLSNGEQLAFQAVSIDSLYPIPVGYKNAKQLPMTFAFDDERYTNNILSAIWLYDATLNKHINLLSENYTFTPNSSNEDNRFYITIEFGVATNIENCEYENENVIFDILGRKVNQVYRNGIYIILKNRKYNKVVR